jgi:plasmid stabilization system protein ParE
MRPAPASGGSFADELDVELQKIASDPYRFRKTGKNHSYRRAPVVTRFEYTIYFTVTEDEIAIASVFHPKRNPEVLKRRGII